MGWEVIMSFDLDGDSIACVFGEEATTTPSLARPAGFEPATYGLEDRCSIL